MIYTPFGIVTCSYMRCHIKKIQQDLYAVDINNLCIGRYINYNRLKLGVISLTQNNFQRGKI